MKRGFQINGEPDSIKIPHPVAIVNHLAISISEIIVDIRIKIDDGLQIT